MTIILGFIALILIFIHMDLVGIYNALDKIAEHTSKEYKL